MQRSDSYGQYQRFLCNIGRTTEIDIIIYRSVRQLCVQRYRKRWDYSESNFPTRHLYLNISRKYTQEESDREFIFSFVDKNISKEKDLFIDKSSEKWFRVGKILALHQDYNYGIDEFAEDNNIDKESKRLLRLLDNVIHTKLNINFYEEDEQKT